MLSTGSACPDGRTRRAKVWDADIGGCASGARGTCAIDQDFFEVVKDGRNVERVSAVSGP